MTDQDAMPEVIQRYSLTWTGPYHDRLTLSAEPDGKFVKYADHESTIRDLVGALREVRFMWTNAYSPKDKAEWLKQCDDLLAKHAEVK